MALDSQEKRMAAAGVGRPYMRSKFPVATPDEEWRIASGNAWGGNALSPPTVKGAGIITRVGSHGTSMMPDGSFAGKVAGGGVPMVLLVMEHSNQFNGGQAVR